MLNLTFNEPVRRSSLDAGEAATDLVNDGRVDDRGDVIPPRPPELVEGYMNPAQKWMVQCSLCSKWRFACL